MQLQVLARLVALLVTATAVCAAPIGEYGTLLPRKDTISKMMAAVPSTDTATAVPASKAAPVRNTKCEAEAENGMSGGASSSSCGSDGSTSTTSSASSFFDSSSSGSSSDDGSTSSSSSSCGLTGCASASGSSSSGHSSSSSSGSNGLVNVSGITLVSTGAESEGSD